MEQKPKQSSENFIKEQTLKRQKQLFLKEKIIHLNNETLYN
jgi:hypothetical protein